MILFSVEERVKENDSPSSSAAAALLLLLSALHARRRSHAHCVAERSEKQQQNTPPHQRALYSFPPPASSAAAAQAAALPKSRSLRASWPASRWRWAVDSAEGGAGGGGGGDAAAAASPGEASSLVDSIFSRFKMWSERAEGRRRLRYFFASHFSEEKLDKLKSTTRKAAPLHRQTAFFRTFLYPQVHYTPFPSLQD